MEKIYTKNLGRKRLVLLARGNDQGTEQRARARNPTISLMGMRMSMLQPLLKFR